MNNDLISRPELKKHKFTVQIRNGVAIEEIEVVSVASIDNAPPEGDLIKAFELLKAHCKNRECNKDCVFYRELRVGDNTEQFCGLCEIVTSDDKENNND